MKAQAGKTGKAGSQRTLLGSEGLNKGRGYRKLSETSKKKPVSKAVAKRLSDNRKIRKLSETPKKRGR